MQKKPQAEGLSETVQHMRDQLTTWASRRIANGDKADDIRAALTDVLEKPLKAK